MLRHILATAMLAGAALTAAAGDCGPSLQSLNPTVPEMYTSGGQLNISFEIDLGALDPGPSQELVYTPVLLETDGSRGAELGKIVVRGRNAAILARRHGARRLEGVALEVEAGKSPAGTVNYSASLPYEQWMENSTLYIVEDLCGCGAIAATDRVALAAFDNRPVVVEDLVQLMVEPKLEKPKIRHEEGSAYVDFVVDRYVINPSYHNNRAELDRIIETIDLVRNDRNVEITNIDIHGFASPEGPYDHNVFLARERTAALTKYVEGLYTIPHELFSQQSTPEDWAGVKKYVEGSELSDKEALLAVIDDTTLTPDEKDRRLRTDFPASYRVLLAECYPYLRRSDYVISYEVRPFSPEEALEVMKTNPKQVSLYEMFWAAQSLGVGSEPYNDIAYLAVETYPEEPVANYNASIVAINRGDYDRARTYLSRLPRTGETLNLLGVIELNTGNYAAAADCFAASAAEGFAPAEENLQLIERLKTYERQNR